MTTNDDFIDLVNSFQAYLERERSTARGSNIEHSTAKVFREKFSKSLAGLASKFPDAPDIVFVRNLVAFAVKGLDDKTSTVIWNNYFRRGDTLTEAANDLDVSTRTVRRFIIQFAEKIVSYLWEAEIVAPDPPKNIPIEKKAAKILEDTFGLTVRQSEVLCAFCLNGDLSRDKIQDDILVISENTLKTHISRIVKTLGVKSMNNAVKKAMRTLKKELGGELK